ncbi:MAG TPA: 4-alpha-glucanotransferase [Bacteroidales bacterium]|nr:4-alpha-glucanotransferase [Bacteroidales bacterium]
MKLQFNIHYITYGNQVLSLIGNSSQTGRFNEKDAIALKPSEDGVWKLELDVPEAGVLEYRYLIRNNGQTERREWGENRCVVIPSGLESYTVYDAWQDEPDKSFLYTSAFTDSLLRVEHETSDIVYASNRVILKVHAPFVRKNQCLGISGDCGLFGGWKTDKALRMHSERFPEWIISLDANSLPLTSNYKFVLLGKISGKILHFEWGEPRILVIPSDTEKKLIQHTGMYFRFQEAPWKGAGVAIPIFSLRTDDSWGCGDFGDLRKMTDWAVSTGMQLIQTLPVNDTTLTETWRDSYPYSAISNYALHPMYCSMVDLPDLKDQKLMDGLEAARVKLNELPELDYEQVLQLKWKYFKELFNQEGLVTLASNEFKTFFDRNKDWLIPYAAFCYLRWKTGQTDFRNWGEWAEYKIDKILALSNPNEAHYPEIAIHYYIQYLLHIQLTEAREYAHKHSVVLKGDIPIGVSRNSVEAWSESSLFNMDAQVGAPPDNFSVTGQNWGFPSYNWDRMKSDQYSWWKRRFNKMADYFDAYRIDHILGFFRIWEIPAHSVEGLLGYFNPALPLQAQDMMNYGFHFEPKDMATPFLPENLINNLFGKDAPTIFKKYLKKKHDGFYLLKSAFETQQLIKAHFGEGPLEPEVVALRDKLYSLCSEVLFVPDPYQSGFYHPRISAFGTERFRWLNDDQKNAFGRLYNDFFYVRNVEFWRQKALEKLPELVHSTRMLSCGEDLGMVPSCVADVMNQLKILSLEIQRMPKSTGALFENLNNIPYQSVCTTSTHDMSPLRAWWLEDRSTIQQYYNQILWKGGEAPWECNPELATIVVENHLATPAIWVILPWQDWMATDKKLRNPDPLAERINIPSNPQHYWRYRMHITLDQLLKAKTFNAKIKEMVLKSGRG